MKVKSGVKLVGLQLEMRKILIEADKIWKDRGQELVITSTTDGVHSPGSLHPYGYAIDLRTRYFDAVDHQAIALILQTKLGSKYDVIVHRTHIHVECDVVIR